MNTWILVLMLIAPDGSHMSQSTVLVKDKGTCSLFGEAWDKSMERPNMRAVHYCIDPISEVENG